MSKKTRYIVKSINGSGEGYIQNPKYNDEDYESDVILYTNDISKAKIFSSKKAAAEFADCIMCGDEPFEYEIETVRI